MKPFTKNTSICMRMVHYRYREGPVLFNLCVCSEHIRTGTDEMNIIEV